MRGAGVSCIVKRQIMASVRAVGTVDGRVLGAEGRDERGQVTPVQLLSLVSFGGSGPLITHRMRAAFLFRLWFDRAVKVVGQLDVANFDPVTSPAN